MTCLFLLGWLVGASGCAVDHYPLPESPRPPAPLPDELTRRFDYAPIGSVALSPTWSDDEVEVFEGKLEIRVLSQVGARVASEFPEDPHERGAEQPVGPSPRAGKDTRGPSRDDDDDDPSVVKVKFEFWRSRSAGADPAPCVLVTPILGGGRRLARTNCRDFARGGMHVVLAWRGTRVLQEDWALEDVERFFVKAIAARRALLDWAAQRPEVDPERLAAFGISMGGIVTSVLAAVEPRLKAQVVALAGGDIPAVVRTSDEGRLVRFRAARAAELGVGPEELESQFRAVFSLDPLRVARFVDPREVLMITTRYDWIVLPVYQERLWEALGKPLRYDIPTGHYSGILYLPYITERIVRWFRARLIPPPLR